MNVRIFWVRAMKCMCAQTRPLFILSSEGVFGGMEFEPMLTPREKSPLPEKVPRGGSNPRRCGQRAQALPTELFQPPISEYEKNIYVTAILTHFWQSKAWVTLLASSRFWCWETIADEFSQISHLLQLHTKPPKHGSYVERKAHNLFSLKSIAFASVDVQRKNNEKRKQEKSKAPIWIRNILVSGPGLHVYCQKCVKNEINQ